MKRDQDFDVALRDIDYVRERARQSRAHGGHIITAAAVGACGLDGTVAMQAPLCPDFSLDYLCANYSMSVASATIAGLATTTITFNPLDSVFCPIAINSRALDSVDNTLVRTTRVFDVNIRKCTQMEWNNPADTVAGATSWIDTLSEWDATAKNSCKACPVDWGCFTNTGQGSALLTMIVGNPHPAPVVVKFTLFGIPYSCCPAFYGKDRLDQGLRRPVSPPAPIGSAKRASPFAQ